ncbi:hypothetical protein OS493_034052 [Desmophyllum pertusum]|uniref:Uncharacterized protein n=1 Tax=Desmophyllum pertusum TaxID=174260 RepID=A0A9X0CQ58_9CNID|nr:hypothetical protein OS493_034052 [Desmophyllum pertusum]
MDTLHLLHVLSKSVQDIGHGVMLAKQDDIDSKTLVCFSDKRGVFHYGYGYKCGGNLRVVGWEEDAKKLRTVPEGSFVIAFTGIRTWKQFDAESFQSGDFLFKDWFDDEKKRAVEEELQALIKKEEMISDAVDLLARLNIEEIGKAIEHIKQLRPNT